MGNKILAIKTLSTALGHAEYSYLEKSWSRVSREAQHPTEFTQLVPNLLGPQVQVLQLQAIQQTSLLPNVFLSAELHLHRALSYLLFVFTTTLHPLFRNNI